MGRYLASKRYKTKRYTRDLDQVLHDDLSSHKAIDALENQPVDEYKPGLGQFYCVPCARYCETEHALETHQRSKVHKRQLKALKFGPYTHQEADAGAGKDVQVYLNKQQQQRNIHAEPRVQNLLTVPEKIEKKNEMATELDQADELSSTESENQNEPAEAQESVEIS
ncbi:Bud site selection protein 20 [Wickerhamiella sorbophila]|uniref:Bud site selection protein 20 n=1 Tax=Wickerhamiella sorbophila TaxID=45607 RepID=A0A2T0FHX2_9ASCO|nr:Bud site selection protein 20 [Wickerhamiella sorbophila]PRT54566.1 Bud site selection protein 20 [Wickerhamiella sorbophila]